MGKSKSNFFLKNILLFSIGGFLPKLLSFVLVPLYTGYLTTQEYGRAEILIVTVALLLPVISLNIQEAVMRFSMDDKVETKTVFSIGVKTVLVSSLVLFAILFGILIIFDGLLSYIEIGFIFAYYLFGSIYNLFSYFCRAINQSKIIMIGSILNSFITLSVSVLLIAVFGIGYKGYLIALVSGPFVASVIMFVFAKIYKYINIKTNKEIRKMMLVYSIPLIFNEIAWWINSASDRYIVSWICGLSISGIYAVAYKLPNILATVQTIFSQAWSISAIKEYDSNDTDGFIGKTFSNMSMIMTVGCTLLLLLNIPMSKILFSKDFFKAWFFVPPLMVSAVVNSKIRFLGSLLSAVKDTKTIAMTTVLGAVINVIGNIVLTFAIGAYGAALSTLLGYLINLFIRENKVKKYISAKYNKVTDKISLLVLCAQMALAYFGVKTIVFQLLCAIAIFIIYRNDIKDMVVTFIKNVKLQISNGSLRKGQ